MEDVKHFVITLFNIKIYQKDKAKRDVLTDEWLRERLDLFERYCLPSMKQQTDKDYVWLCLFDKETRAIADRLEAYKAAVPQFTPLFLDGSQAAEWKAYVCKTILKMTSPPPMR